MKQKSKIKIIYRNTIKPIVNVITFRHLRHFLKQHIDYKKRKQQIIDLEKTFPENTVLIFQHQFFDREGTVCFNGGAERYVQDLSNILISLNYKPILVQMAGKKFWERDVGTMHVVGLACTNIDTYLQQIHLFSKFKFVIYSGAVLWSKKLLHPNILISHGVTWDRPNQNINTKNVLNIFTDVDHFVSVDTNTISWLRTTFALTMKNKQMHYVPNYVDTTLYKPISKNNNQRIKIIFPRRASAERGYWLMSAAVPPIMKKYPNVDMDFVGFAHGDTITNDIKKLVSLFPGRVNHYVVKPDEMVSVYQQADISLIPTQFAEGTSLSCLEAQACGNVVISTNIGGLPNLIIDGYNGLLINPDGQELMKALDKILDSEKLREKLSKNAVSVAQVFDKKIWIDRWKKIIQLLTKED